MNKINLEISNNYYAIWMTLFYCIIGIVTLIIPLFFIGYLPQSLVGNYFYINLNLIFFIIPLIVYFIYTGIYIYNIRIDQYIIAVSSFRSISSFFRRKDSIDISHAMLVDYKFFNIKFTFNQILMIKIRTDRNRIIAKRFNLSLLTNKNKTKIVETLDRILKKNK